MRLFGIEITRAKAAPPTLASVPQNPRWWFPVSVREPFTGAWQRNMETRAETTLSFGAVFRCVSLISSDIAKSPIRLVELTDDGIWTPAEAAAFSPVLRKPNKFQNRIQFLESWAGSKLISGNTYVLKVRDNRDVVVGLYVLDPNRVRPLVTPEGDVYYRLGSDNLASLKDDDIILPASEVIHDRWNTFFHPLVGLSPIFAAGIPALQGMHIQNSSASFFGNGARPSGILMAPGEISKETAEEIKEGWQTQFTGLNAGRVAVLGDGLKYEPMMMSAVDAQLIEQLKWSAETVCSVFGVPSYMIGVGPSPSYNNIEALRLQYYAQCLQIHIEAIELCLDEGLGLDMRKDGGTFYGTEFDLDALLRMDTATLVRTEAEAVGAGIKSPNEARLRLNLGPADGGGSPMMQQQNFSLAALAERDRDKPFAQPTAPPPAADAGGEEPDDAPDNEGEGDEGDAERVFGALFARSLEGEAIETGVA